MLNKINNNNKKRNNEAFYEYYRITIGGEDR
jgi:hypothetical protein